MDIVLKLFGTTNLYEILNISTDTVGDEKVLKTAYLRAALKYHPDKGSQDAAEREERTNKFQVIQQIFEMLKDADLRKSYEETGEWPDKEELVLDSSPFGKLDEQTILEFKKYYLGSEEEREDVMKLYKEGKGDILHVLEHLFFANILDDEERVQGIIDELIKTEQMEKLGNGVDLKAREKKIKKAKKEAAEAEKMRKDMNIGSLGGLENAIAQNAAKRNSFIDDLEKKYGGAAKNGKASGSKGRGRPPKSTPIDDEAEEDDEETATKAKKGRGRPPKVAKGRGRPPVVADSDDEEVNDAPKAKKGRGRPAKSAPIEEDEDEQEAAPKAKNGHGRPPKKSSSMEEDDEAVEDEQEVAKVKNGQESPKKSTPMDDEDEEEVIPKAKKGRGRPPKVAHSDDEEDEDVPKAKKHKPDATSSVKANPAAGKRGRGRPPKVK